MWLVIKFVLSNKGDLNHDLINYTALSTRTDGDKVKLEALKERGMEMNEH